MTGKASRLAEPQRTYICLALGLKPVSCQMQNSSFASPVQHEAQIALFVLMFQQGISAVYVNKCRKKKKYTEI